MAISTENFVSLIGCLGDTPLMKNLPNGTLLIEMSLATNSQYTDREGNKVKLTEWHRLKAFGKLAEVMSTYLKKGSKISVLGTIRYSKWVDKYEQNRVSTDIVVASFSFLDTRRQDNNNNNNRSSTYEDEGYDKAPPRNNAQPSKKKLQQAAMADEATMPATEKLPF